MNDVFPNLFAVWLWGQELEAKDLVVVGLLVLLEGLLSIDNALVLGMLVKRLPKHLREKALFYGLVGAFVFRFIAILSAAYLLQWTFVKFLGGMYLVYIAVKHLFFESQETTEEKIILDNDGNPKMVDALTGESLNITRENLEIEQRVPIAAGLVTQDGQDESPGIQYAEGAACDVPSHTFTFFWKTVLVIELTDIAFAVDSILAAIALAGSSDSKLWVVITGGILGVALMRFAAAVFVKLLERFPRFEISAYLLVVAIGIKLLADWALNSDWSFSGQSWLGGWHDTFRWLESMRLDCVESYESWLRNNWPLGLAEPKHLPGDLTIRPHLLDFHDLRRPEFFVFWFVMLGCFMIGFLPRSERK